MVKLSFVKIAYEKLMCNNISLCLDIHEAIMYTIQIVANDVLPNTAKLSDSNYLFDG